VAGAEILARMLIRINERHSSMTKMELARRLVFSSLILACVAGGVARGDDGGEDPQKQEPPKTDAPPPKTPPPPLLPRHRRGIYLNGQGLEVIDATPQSPPLDIDDPSVPEKGAYEINLSVDTDLSRNLQRVDLLFIDANYGLVPTIAGHELPAQLKVEFPVAAARAAGDPFLFGVGATTLGLKVNFLNNEEKGLSVSVYPQVEFGTPGTRAVEKGLAKPGQTLILPLLVAREFKYFTLVANGAVEKPLHDGQRETTGAFGLGGGLALTRKVAVMMEVRAESTFDLQRDRLVLLNVGVIHGVRNVIVYGHLGRSLFSEGGVVHTYVGFGMKVLIKPPTT
jgi:hypothetical protein